MQITQETFERFMIVLANGMDLVSIQPEAGISMRDVQLKRDGYTQLDTVLDAIITAGYDPAAVVQPILDAVCTRFREPIHAYPELKNRLDNAFAINVDVPLYASFETYYLQHHPMNMTDNTWTVVWREGRKDRYEYCHSEAEVRDWVWRLSEEWDDSDGTLGAHPYHVSVFPPGTRRDGMTYIE